MTTLTVRNLDEAVVARLKQRAREHGRSLESEVRDLLAHYANKPTPAEMKRLAQRIAATTDPARQTDSVDLLREDRSR